MCHRRTSAFVLLPALLLSIIVCAGQAHAADRPCTAIERTAADRQLRLSSADRQQSLAANLLWGTPHANQASDHEVTLVQRDYVIGYDGDLRVPLWTAHRVRATGLGRVERINCFRADGRLLQDAASTPTDYTEPLFDQGHLTPNGDMSFGKTAVINSFIMSNMTPQYCQFNRGVWEMLESLVRYWASQDGDLYVISGSIFDRDSNGERDADTDAWRMHSTNGHRRVAIPSAFFKILARPHPHGRTETLTIILPHDRTDVSPGEELGYLSHHIGTIADVEHATGLEIANGHSVDEATALWPSDGATLRTLVNSNCRAVTAMR